MLTAGLLTLGYGCERVVSLGKRVLFYSLFVCVLFMSHRSVQASWVDGSRENDDLRHADESLEQKSEETKELEILRRKYWEYQEKFAAIETVDDIETNGYQVIESQSFSVILESFGEEEVLFLPIVETQYHRLAVIIADAEGRVLFKTNQLETNNRCLGQLEQPTKDVAAVSFHDVNEDGLTDIILITNCENETGAYAGKLYKTGDVLFQRDRSFYRDWRISDKINRFSMNKSTRVIISYVRDGSSTEILYTAATLEELLNNGFQVIQENSYYKNFEKQGRLKIVPGVIRIAQYEVFMIYLVNEQGYIVWSFQPMKDYDNLYALRGMLCTDVDGDGMKDIVVLGKYSYEGADGEVLVDSKCDIYYQRTDGFFVDEGFAEYYQCTEEDTMRELLGIIREYWGWQVEE